MNRRITIVGGGLAGLALGIGLRREGIETVVVEAGTYPRHRVCGEFISGRGLDVLERLGFRTRCEQAGAARAHTVAFLAGDAESPPRRLAVPAMCISRHTLDALLAAGFRERGGELRTGTRWAREDFGAGIVRATGRRAGAVENGWHWFGLKAHARGLNLKADLEMHAVGNGYVGVGLTSGGVANVCGLFRRRTGEASASQAGLDMLRGPVGSRLRKRLEGAVFDESSFTAVAGLRLRPGRAASQAECCIGDAVTMIPPVTGNGMSMAFESAEMAIEPLAAYARGGQNWGRTREAIARRCDAAFARRLAWARLAQWLMFSGLLHGPLGPLALRSEILWRLLFENTR